MKKIYFIIFPILGLTLLFFSCESFLSEEVLDEISSDYIYSTPGGLEVGVTALYNLQRHHMIGSGVNNLFKIAMEFRVGTDLGHSRTWHRPYVWEWTPSGFLGDKWRISYLIIDRCNAIINSAPEIEMKQNEKEHLLAQAKIIRAEVYFDLIRAYDNILLVVTHTTAQNNSDPVEYKPAASADVYALINEDLAFAIEKLDWQVDKGRYSKAVAYHINGKSQMWQGNWSSAAESFDAIIESGYFALQSHPKDVFTNTNHTEALFVYPLNEELGGSPELAGGGENAYSAIFLNRYYELSSKELIRDVKYGGASYAWSFPNDYLQSLYDKQNDRRYETYYWPLKYINNNPDHPNFGKPLLPGSYEDNYRRYHWSLKKYFDPDKPEGNGNGFKDLMFYRYAETLLIGSEAHWRLGHNDKALNYINQIRIRAGIEPYVSYNLDFYLEESARELAFEGNRWFLLKRLGLLVERQQKYFTIGDNSRNKKLSPMDPWEVRLPIPQDQIDLMGTFPQNPGYPQ